MKPRSLLKFAVALALVLLLTATGFAQISKKGLSVDTIFDWRTVADPEISPDGKQIVYVYGWTDKVNDTTRSNLWIVNVDTRENRPLTEGNEQRDSSPRWSPDGKHMAFLSNKSGGGVQLFVRWMDSTQEAQITNDQQSPSNIAWSPDGQWIAFTKLIPSKPATRIRMPERPANAKWAEPPMYITRLWYRQDGQGYRPNGFTHIFIVPATGGAPRQITSGDYDHGAPEWTRDGQWILTSAIRKPDAEWQHGDSEIYAFNVAEGSVKALTDHRGPDGGPKVSPNGKFIVWTGFDEKRNSYTVSKLYLMNSDGSNPHPLTTHFDRDVQQIEWAPDSSGIYFVSGDRGSQNVHFAPVSGGAVKPITQGAHLISNVSISASGRAAAAVTSPQEPGDVVTFALSSPSVDRLTRVNESLLAQHKLGAVEEIWYDSFDGKKIQGWIVKPPDFDPSRKYPMILYIHGGPHAMYGVGFNHEFQCHAANGYVVLYTNPRGSTGYGQEFGNIIQFNYPGDDFKDLMKGVDFVLQKGYVDENKMGVTGGSGGGLLTAWTVTHTNRFAAAVSQYPVINWYSFVGTADGGHNMGWRWLKQWPWEDEQGALQHSPITFVNNVKTPTMVITGEQDFRTPIEQSEQFYRALKINKIDAALVRVPDEPHGASSVHPTHRIAKVLYVMQWMDDHIKEKSTAQ